MREKRIGKVNIVHYVTHQYMMRNKKRTATAFVGILFMVLLMTCVFVGKDTAVAFLQEAASMREGKWHYALYDITEAQYEEIRNLDYVKATAESVPLGMTDFAQSADKERPYLNVKAYETLCFEWFNVKLTKGRLPEQEDEIILSSACLEDGADIQIGDKIDAKFFRRTFTGTQESSKIKTIFPMYDFFEIPYGKTVVPPEQFPYFEQNADFTENREMTGIAGKYTVVGFMEVPVYEKKDGAGYTALTLWTQSRIQNQKTSAGAYVHNVSLQVDFTRAPKDVYLSLYEEMGEEHVDANDVYLSFTGTSSDRTINLMVSLMTVFFVAVIMVASITLICNVFNLSFRERSRYLGMLSSVGATARQKRSSVYYEACYLLLFAMPAGILLGFAVIRGGMALLKPFLIQFVMADGFSIQDIPVTLLVSWKAILSVAAVSLFTVLISAFLPARVISRSGAVESIRGNENHKSRTYRMGQIVYKKGGAVRMLAGNVCRRQRKKKKSISLSVIVFLVILIVTAFGADMVHLILEKKTTDASMIGMDIGEQEGMLYDRSLVSMDEAEADQIHENFELVKDAVIHHKDTQELKEWYQGIWCGNISYGEFYSQEYLDAKFEIAKAYLGRQLSEEQILKNYFTESFTNVCILVVDETSLQDIAQRCGADSRVLADISGLGVIVFNEVELSTDNTRYESENPDRSLYYEIAKISDLNAGEQFPISLYDETAEKDREQLFTIAGYADRAALKGYASISGESTWLIMGTKAAEFLSGSLGYEDISAMFEEADRITFAPDSEELRDYLNAINENPDGGSYFADSNSHQVRLTMMQAIARTVDIMLLCFVLLTSMICFINLANSIAGRMAERRKEFAVMQSIGMTRIQIQQMLFLECSRILASAVLEALLISALLIGGVRQVLSDLFGRLVFQIPFVLIILAAAVAVGAVFILTFYAFGKEKEQNLLEEIRRETV